MRFFKKIFLGVICSVLAVTGTVTYFVVDHFDTSVAKETVTYTLNGEEVKIDIYTRATDETDGAPTFVVGETINKAINYKKQNLTEDVEVKFAIYRVNCETACYYKPNTLNYGKMTKLDADYTDDCERIMYSLVKSALWGIKTDFIFHIDNGKTIPYLNKFMDETCKHDSSKKVRDYLTVRQCEWPLDNRSAYQMHSKQLLVSDYLDWNGKEYKDAVWVATSNVDYYSAFTNLPIPTKNWSHSGFMVSNNSELYIQNEKFYDVTFENYKDRDIYVEEVNKLRAEGELKYIDDHIEMYFTPMDQTSMDAWDHENNPVAKYIDRLAEAEGRIEFRMNMYSVGANTYETRLANTLYEAFSNNKTKGNYLGFKLDDGWTEESPLYKILEPYAEAYFDIKTHAKDYLFYFEETDEYVVITGTTNTSLGEALWKANQIAVFKEYGDNHPIYDAYLDLYNRTVAKTTVVEGGGE